MDPGVAHDCFNLCRGVGPTGGWFCTHGNIQVNVPSSGFEHNARCSAIETQLTDPDDPENIWRSFRDPGAKNHGHGRGASTFDQFTERNSTTGLQFDEGIWQQAENATRETEPIYNAFCDGGGVCACGQAYGGSHTNNGIHNRFFYDLSGYADAKYPLVKDDIVGSAKKQRELLDQIYADSTTGYTPWADKVTNIAASSGSFNVNQKKNLLASLRVTRVFHDAGSIAGGAQYAPSDLETVWYWRNVDNQRLYVFFRYPESWKPNDAPWGAGPNYYHPKRYERPLAYAAIPMSGTNADWSNMKLCKMPDVSIPSAGGQISRSGFAPTVVASEGRLWVFWSQYQQAPHYQVGDDFGYLSYATLAPEMTASGQDPVCGAWSGVAYDPQTVVYGSPRATVVDRGSIYIVELPPFYQDPCIGCDTPIHAPWFDYVAPVGQTTLDMLANLGFAPDVPMDQVWAGHPGWVGGETTVSSQSTPQLLVGNDFESENLVHLHAAVRGIMTDDSLGVNTRPLHDNGLAPQGAAREIGLRALGLDDTFSVSTMERPDIVEAAAMLLPNAVSFITRPLPRDRAPTPVWLGTQLVQGIGGMAGKWAVDLDVKSVAVAFLRGAKDSKGRRTVVVRQYGVTEDPFTPLDTGIGKARFVPGMTTLGLAHAWIPSQGETELLRRDNVVACTDFAYDGMNDATDTQMRCKVFENGFIATNGGRLEKLWPEGATVGPDIIVTASPRAVNVGDTAYIFYRSADGRMKYVAFAGPEFEPVTYNAVLAGLRFPDNFDGPSKLVTDVATPLTLTALQTKPGGLWPLMDGAPFVSAHGGLGLAGTDSSTTALHLWMRGLWSE
ncbi:MAG: hypothetical protein PHU25_21575 [Deltaproteobacteria bacterium]|nr:hypothetical protein [Deltaproteobacteria bacterium]